MANETEAGALQHRLRLCDAEIREAKSQHFADVRLGILAKRRRKIQAGIKKAKAAMEVAKQVAEDMPDATDDDKAAETDRRCQQLKDKGLFIEQWDLDDIEADLDWCGMSGSPTKVHRIQSIVLAGGEYHEFPPTDEGVAELIGNLIEDHTIG